MENIVYSFFAPDSDARKGRVKEWRPSLSLVCQENFPVTEFHLIYQEKTEDAQGRITENLPAVQNLEADIRTIAPRTRIERTSLEFKNPWDFEEVYKKLYLFCTKIKFNREHNYFFNVSNGTGIFRICIFLLAEKHYFNGKLILASPSTKGQAIYKGNITHLDPSKYEKIRKLFQKESNDKVEILKDNISTRNERYNNLISEIEKTVRRSERPILLTGETGTGKTQLVKKIYELRKNAGMKGEFVDINCATLRGESAWSALFGHKKGSFTDAKENRNGALREADGGLLFLDEIGEVSLEVQAMLLKAIEDKSFKPFGADKNETSNFQLICGTNRDLDEAVNNGTFRRDLLSRIDDWKYELPPLRERKEDIEPNINKKLEEYREKKNVDFDQGVLKIYLAFAESEEAVWTANFRDLNNSILRMCEMADDGTITEADVKKEIGQLKRKWSTLARKNTDDSYTGELGRIIGSQDAVEQVQLKYVIKVCGESQTMAEAARKLFDKSRCNRKTKNDSDRLKKYLERYDGLTWDMIRHKSTASP
jgi:transcriptional regulatory protein RtcR